MVNEQDLPYMQPITPCIFCEKVSDLENVDNLEDTDNKSFIIHNFPHSILIVGEHQAFPGYCVLVAKSHIAKLHEMETAIQTALFTELMQAASAINKAYPCKQLNYACYGNMVPHVHWHIFPRHENDIAWPKPVWTKMHEFSNYTTLNNDAIKIRNHIKNFLS